MTITIPGPRRRAGRRARPGVAPLEPRALLTAAAWGSYARNAQHTALAPAAAQPLQTILWQTPVDLNPQYNGNDLLIHYGSPLVTANDTVIVPVKTGATNGFEVQGRGARDGALLWNQATDYSLPPFNGWTPSFGPTLAPSGRLYFPAADGTLEFINNPDAAGATVSGRIAFYGTSNYNQNPSTYSDVFISTPITTDAAGDLYFGFVVTGTNSAGLKSGLARIDPGGNGTWIAAPTAAGDSAITEVVQNCAPALSNDGSTVYVAVSKGNFSSGYLLALDSTTLQPKSKVALVDPNTLQPSLLPDDGTASPTVGPDGDVYFGVLQAPFNTNHDRGWLLHFTSNLTESDAKPPGAFGWDDTASIVPAAMVPSYAGTSSYLVMTKFNDYAGEGGSGINKIAVLDPNAMADDPVTGACVMQVVESIAGPTPDPEFDATHPGAVREWCINTAAVDPATDSILANSEDGNLYRWDLKTNTLSQSVTLTPGVGEAYTPTVVGPDGVVYAINNATLFAVGALGAPAGLAATTPTPGSAHLSWSPVPGAQSYEVESSYDGQHNWAQVATAPGGVTSTDLAGLAPGVVAYFRVLAVAGPITSGPSPLAFAKPTGANWPGVYGADGFEVVGGTTALPSYATVTPSGQSSWTWAASTTDPRAPLASNAPGAGRVMATWYSPSRFTVDVNLTDGQAHRVTLYAVDWDYGGRTERFDVVDPTTGNVLASQTISSFTSGRFVTFTLSGHEQLLVTRLGGHNAVLSGLFFDTTPPSATFDAADGITRGDWVGSFGADGVEVVGAPAALPSYATVTPSGQSTITWSTGPNDSRAPLVPGATGRVAEAWSAASSFTIDVDLADGRPHRVSLYAVDWDNAGRSERIDVVDPNTGAVLVSRTISGFQGGEYLSWVLTGDVQLRVTNLNSSTTAVVSGLFFGAAPNEVAFAGADATTRGNWVGPYGADGSEVVGGTTALPSYATVTPSGQSSWTWAASTTDSRALLASNAPGAGRVAATWYGQTVTLEVNLAGDALHRVSLYAVDWDNRGRVERIDVIDPTTGAVLDSRTISSFTGGDYLSWNLRGHVQIRVTNLAGPNAVVSGLFFGPGA
ncbi:MAG TPA: fibronectin type III domain-containing protein [Isosphaeraceae bacterium]|jgi:hypothetical protein|nr:fibronectin type III domain-containing protein [Isosphaeraceae bacterium]